MRLDPTACGTRQVPIMIASSGFGLLALFSLLSILLGDDRRRRPDDDPELWMYRIR